MEEKKDKKNIIIAILIIIIIALATTLLLVVLNKKDSKTNNETRTEEKAKDKEKDKEKDKDKKKDKESEIEPEPEPEFEPSNINVNDLNELAKALVPSQYSQIDVMSEIYLNKKIDLTKLDDSTKNQWLLSSLGKIYNYNIPSCTTEDGLSIAKEDFIKYSLFEDNSYIENIEDTGELYQVTFKKGLYYVKVADCDGRGPGINPYEKVEFVSSETKNDRIYVTVRFAYLVPNWDKTTNPSEDLVFYVYGSYNENEKPLMDNYDAPYTSKLDDTNSKKYQITFKIKDKKLYPLEIEPK